MQSRGFNLWKRRSSSSRSPPRRSPRRNYKANDEGYGAVSSFFSANIAGQRKGPALPLLATEAADEDDETEKGEGRGHKHERNPTMWASFAEWFGQEDGERTTRRLMDRRGSYGQSEGRWNIKRVRKGVEGLQELYAHDRFHTLVNMRTGVLLAMIMAVYLGTVACFALIYLLIAKNIGCEMGISDFRDAYFFSLETMTTVGYGTDDVFFGGCWTVMSVISFQACTGLFIDAVLIGLIFSRLARPQTRAATVVFSKYAIIRRIRGEYYLQFQVGELRKHQLLETHIRCYAVRHDRTLPMTPEGKINPMGPTETVHFQTHNLRLQHPDDELGGPLLLVLPQVIVHRVYAMYIVQKECFAAANIYVRVVLPLNAMDHHIEIVSGLDSWSPLMPPPRWVSEQGLVQWGIHEDVDHDKAPWQQSPRNELGRRTSEGTSASSADSAPSESSPGKRPQMLRRQSGYWDNDFSENKNLALGDKGPGYVYRFPDLLKRWDDVDGDRGTWYERMKKRMIQMEENQLQSELEMQQVKASANLKKDDEEDDGDDDESASALPPRISTVGRRSSLMQILPTSPSSGMQRGPSTMRFRSNSTGYSPQASPRTSPRSPAALSTVRENWPSPRAKARAPSPAPSPPLTRKGQAHQWFADEEKRAISAYMIDREVEVIAVVEGVDTSSGSTVQCRHSYAHTDLVWDHTFAQCVFKDKAGICTVDFNKFHDIKKAPSNCLDGGFIQSYA